MHPLLSILLQNHALKSDSSRLFHGRGGLFPDFQNIVVDFFSPTLLITLYKEVDEKIIESLLNFPAENILLQKRFLHRPELVVLKGSIPEKGQAFEDGMLFHLKFGASQNIGFFLDMAQGRKWIREHAFGKKVLNLFSYTCSLSVAALKGGASGVVNVDMSKGALSVGRDNHLLNQIKMNDVKFLPYDILKSWKNISKYGPYDLVVIDPPTNQGESFKVERDYYKMIKRLDEMTNPEALVFACLNSPHLKSQFLIELFIEHAPQFVFQERVQSAFIDSENDFEAGLKILVFKKGSKVPEN